MATGCCRQSLPPRPSEPSFGPNRDKAGSAPASLLDSKCSVVSAISGVKSGRGDSNWLRCRYSDERRVRDVIAAGMVPLSWLVFMNRWLILVKLPNESGTVPVSELKAKPSVVRLVSWPKFVGMVPGK